MVVLHLKEVNSVVQTCKYVSSDNIEVSLDNADCDACTGCQCQPVSEATSDGTCLLVSIMLYLHFMCASLFMCMFHAITSALSEGCSKV